MLECISFAPSQNNEKYYIPIKTQQERIETNATPLRSTLEKNCTLFSNSQIKLLRVLPKEVRSIQYQFFRNKKLCTMSRTNA